MLTVSDLSKEQIQEIKDWVEGGAQMADLQKRLKEDFDLNATYMDTRFLALDLDLDFHKEEEAEEELAEDIVAEDIVAEDSGNGEPPAGVEVIPPSGSEPAVSVGIDQIAIPGSMVSGTVTFSDGEKGTWMIDVDGRPSIDPETDDYRPNQEDLVDFQAKLQHIFETQM